MLWPEISHWDASHLRSRTLLNAACSALNALTLQYRYVCCHSLSVPDVCRYFVASSSKDLLRYLTRDSEWISKICAGLIEEGVEGAPAAAAAGAGAGGRGCSKADLEREEALTNSVVQSLNSAAGLAFGTLMQVGGAMACLKPFLYCFPVAVTPALPVAAFQGAFGRRCFGNGPIPLEHGRKFFVASFTCLETRFLRGNLNSNLGHGVSVMLLCRPAVLWTPRQQDKSWLT